MAKKRRGSNKKRGKGKGRRIWYPFVPATEERYISVETGPVELVFRITGHIHRESDGEIEVKAIPIEDTIRPVDLTFTPPLRHLGKKAEGFDYQWQQLEFLFELNDPMSFLDLSETLSQDEVSLLARFVQTCCHLAGYSLISGSHGLSLATNREAEEPSVLVDLPSHEEFTAFSATFRQIHNDGEEASFNKAWRILNRAVQLSDHGTSKQARAVDELKKWKKARNSLRGKAAATLIAEKLKPNMKEDTPRPLRGIVPDDLIRKFNYGDTLHWGNQRENLAELTENVKAYERYYRYCCSKTMTSLSHLYFGFAVLAAASLDAADQLGVART